MAIKKYGIQNFSREILEWCDSRESLNKKEIYWISCLNSTNEHIGYNISSGGNCPNIEHLSSEHRQKLSVSNLGKPHQLTEVGRSKIRESNTCRIISDETRKKLSQANYGKQISEQTRQKISIAKKGKPLNLTDEQRQKIVKRTTGSNNPNWGKPRSQETRKKISESNIGKPGSRLGMHNSPEHNRKLREANIGRKVSEESRAKMSQSALTRMCTLICQKCGEQFNARGPRTRFCPICKEYNNGD